MDKHCNTTDSQIVVLISYALLQEHIVGLVADCTGCASVV